MARSSACVHRLEGDWRTSVHCLELPWRLRGHLSCSNKSRTGERNGVAECNSVLGFYAKCKAVSSAFKTRSVGRAPPGAWRCKSCHKSLVGSSLKSSDSAKSDRTRVDCSVIDDKLIRQMLEATDHPAALAAFASIVFAPRALTDFGQNLIILKETRTPMCMIYGKEDPWVVPFCGQRAKQRNPDAVYYELSPAGHCPHHEAPEVVNTLVRKWVESVQSQGALSPPLLDAGVNQKQLHWFVVENEGKRVSVRVKGTQGFWGNFVDSFKVFQ